MSRITTPKTALELLRREVKTAVELFESPCEDYILLRLELVENHGLLDISDNY